MKMSKVIRLIIGRSNGNAKKVSCLIYNGVSGGDSISSTVPDIPDNQWVHIGFTYNHITGTAEVSYLKFEMLTEKFIE